MFWTIKIGAKIELKIGKSKTKTLFQSCCITCFLRRASIRYKPLQAALIPAASVSKPERLRYEQKRRAGGKIIGNGWKGRRCCEAINVASPAGGTECSVQKRDTWSANEVFFFFFFGWMSTCKMQCELNQRGAAVILKW